MKKFKKNSNWINYCKKTRNKYPIVLESMVKQKKFVNSSASNESLATLTLKLLLDKYISSNSLILLSSSIHNKWGKFFI